MNVTKKFTFDAAHRLSGYVGKCKNLHGHTYLLEVTLTGEINHMGFIVDFGDLKTVVSKMLDTYFDHKTILRLEDDMNLAIQKILPPESVYMVSYNPTAENMVLDIWEKLYEAFLSVETTAKIKKIRLYETPTSYAEKEV